MLQAVEELITLSRSDQEREQCEARRKAQLDYNTGIKVSRMDGEQIGVILFLERMMNRPEAPTEELLALSFDDLTRLANALQPGR